MKYFKTESGAMIATTGDIKGKIRDMTPEELAEAEKFQVDMPKPVPTPEERLDTLESTTDDIVLMLADIIGGEE